VRLVLFERDAGHGERIRGNHAVAAIHGAWLAAAVAIGVAQEVVRSLRRAAVDRRLCDDRDQRAADFPKK